MPQEAELGICAFLNPDNPGFSGIIKGRSDPYFRVLKYPWVLQNPKVWSRLASVGGGLSKADKTTKSIFLKMKSFWITVPLPPPPLHPTHPTHTVGYFGG